MKHRFQSNDSEWGFGVSVGVASRRLSSTLRLRPEGKPAAPWCSLAVVLVCAFVVAFHASASVLAANDPPRDQAEQLEFDPQTGQWVELEPPEPGTAEGDLALARRYLADERFGKTRRALRKWFKNYGADHALGRDARLSSAAVELADRNYYKAHKILDPLAAEFGTDEVTLRAVELDFVVSEVFLSGTKRQWLGMRMIGAEDLGIKILDDISANYPDSELAEQALKTKADYYFRRGDFDLADDEYARLIVSFPRSQWLLEASLRRAQAMLARFPGTEFDDAALVEAEERFARFRDGFPQAATAHDVDLTLEDIRNTRAEKKFETGRYYEHVGQEQAAAFYYRMLLERWPGTLAATRADGALSRLGLFREATSEATSDPSPTAALETAGMDE